MTKLGTRAGKAYNESAAKRIERVVKTVENARGGRGVFAPDGHAQAPQAFPRFKPNQQQALFTDAWITGAAVFDDNPHRWKYAWEETELGSDDELVAKSGGLTGSTSSNYALNWLEVTNPASPGPMGCGVNTNDADATITLLPVGEALSPTIQVPIRIWYVPIGSGNTRPVFIGINPYTVECPAS